MKRKLIFMVLLMLAITAIAVLFSIITMKNKARGTDADDESRLKIISTFYPVYLIGLNLFDNIDEVELKSLTELDTGCLHDYVLTTEDMRNISEADLLIINGGGMEAFMQDVAENYPDLPVVDASENIDLYQDNPHIWLDPELYIKQIENVRDAFLAYTDNKLNKNIDLTRIKQTVRENAQGYIDRVAEIDAGLDALKEEYITAANLKLSKAVIFHDSFAYIAGKIAMPVAYSIPLDHDTALSAEEISDIIDDVKKEDIKCLFTEEQYSDSVAKRIEAETAARVYIIDSAVTGDGSKNSYIDAMNRNIEVIKSALAD